MKAEKEKVTTLEKRLQNNYNCLLKEMDEKASALIQISIKQESIDKLTKENVDLKTEVTSLKEKLENSEREVSINLTMYNSLTKERGELYSQIKELQDKLLKRGQIDQTIFFEPTKGNQVL